MKVDFIEDAGHGWFSISPKQQQVLGLSRDSFSEFSYIDRDGTIYAEEDCDCAHLFEAAKARDIKLEITDIFINGNAFIRSLQRCWV